MFNDGNSNRRYKTQFRIEGIDGSSYPHDERNEIIPPNIGMRLNFASGRSFRVVDVEFDLSERWTTTMIVWMKEITE